MMNPRQPSTYREALQWAFSLLRDQGENEMIGEWIWLHLLGTDRTQWLMMLDSRPNKQLWQRYVSMMRRIVEDGEPYQYVIGEQSFYGRTYMVNRHVLIPRPETEVLCDVCFQKINEYWPDKSRIQVVDIGTGSGNIAVTLAAENERLQLTAVDCSESALRIARQNAQTHHVNIRFIRSNVLRSLIRDRQKMDVIVSNPPYIAYHDAEVAPNVRNYEPHAALFAANDGLAIYEQLIHESQRVLRQPGLIVLEVGDGQAQRVQRFISETYTEARTEIVPDLRGIPRIVFARI